MQININSLSKAAYENLEGSFKTKPKKYSDMKEYTSKYVDNIIAAANKIKETHLHDYVNFLKSCAIILKSIFAIIYVNNIDANKFIKTE